MNDAIRQHSRYDTDAVHAMDYMGRCVWCSITMKELAELNRERMLTEAFNRLASVLEKLEARLADSPAIPLEPGKEE